MRQPLLAVELYDGGCNQLEYRALVDWEGKTSKLGFNLYLYPWFHKFDFKTNFLKLPQIDEALQAVHSSKWFLSSDLTQGYLQLAMEEDNMKKTTCRARSLGLYKFTCMPFGLSNADSSFCCLMSLGDQQFVTLLLYLDAICIYALSIEVMLDFSELVFNRLKEFHLKIKPKNAIFYTNVLFLGMYYLLVEFQVTPKKKRRDGTGQPSQMQRKYIPS